MSWAFDGFGTNGSFSSAGFSSMRRLVRRPLSVLWLLDLRERRGGGGGGIMFTCDARFVEFALDGGMVEGGVDTSVSGVDIAAPAPEFRD